MVDLPELGIGVVYTPSLEPLLEAGQELIEAIEIEPQPFWLKTRSPENPYRLDKKMSDRINQYRQPKIVHSVGLPIGGTLPLDENYIKCLVESIELFKPVWVSEHLSFNRTRNKKGEFNTGFLLPPLQTPEAVKIAAENIRYLRDRLCIPFAFETGVNYLQPLPGEMTDGNFFAAVAESADCGILLDLHNLWCNEKNGRSSVRDVISKLPLDRVWEIHLAGGQSLQGYWLDAHSGIVPTSVMELAAEIIPTLPNLKAIFWEISENYLQTEDFSIDVLLEQIRQMQQLWNLRSNERRSNIDLNSRSKLNKIAQSGAKERNFQSAKERVPSRGGTDGEFTIPSHAAGTCVRRNEGSPYKVPYAEESKEEVIFALPSISEWEEALGCLAADRQSDLEFIEILDRDRGIEVLQYLVSGLRGGTAVDALKLSSRLLMLSLGKPSFRKLLKEFWKTTPPEMFATEEVKNLANYLKVSDLNVPYLADVLNFELASYQVLIEGLPQTVKFSCEPMSLLNALQENRLPENIVEEEFEIVLDP